MGLFSKKNKLNQKLTEDKNINITDVLDNNKDIYQLYDETIVTKKVKVRCKNCGVFMWVDYTKTIKSLRNLALTNIQQEQIPVMDEPQILQDCNDLSSAPVNNQEDDIVNEHESTPIEPLHEEVEPEPIKNENQSNEEFIQENIIAPVDEVDNSVKEHTPFTPVSFEFEEPVFENIYSNQKVYAENLFLESLFSEKESLINDDQNDFSWLSKYVSVWNKRDEAELAQLVYDECLLAPQSSVFPNNEYFIEEEYEHIDPDNHHNKHKAQRHHRGHDLIVKKNGKEQIEKAIDDILPINNGLDKKQQLLLKTVLIEEEFQSDPISKKTWWETESANKSSKK